MDVERDSTVINPDDLGSDTSSDEIEVLASDDDTTEEEVLSEEEEESSTDDSEDAEDTSSEEDTSEDEEDESDEDDEEEDEEVEEDDELLEEEEEEEEEVDDDSVEASEWQQFKTKFPDAAKDKYVKSIFFRHQKFNEIFPEGLPQAEQAEAKARSLDYIDSSLADGDPTTVFESMDKDVVGKLSQKFLPALFKYNPKYFGEATRPIVLDILHNAMNYSTKTQDDNLRKSVRNLSNYLTGSPDLPDRAGNITENKEIQEEKKKLQEARLNDLRTQEMKFLGAADKRIDTRLNKVINTAIGKDENLTDFAREAIIQRTIHEVKSKLSADKNFDNRLKNLKIQAVRAGFDDTLQKKLVSTYLQVAKKYALAYTKKHKNAALGITTTESKIDKKVKKSKNKVVNTSGKNNSKNRTSGEERTTSRKRVDMNRTSPEDFLAGKVVYK